MLQFSHGYLLVACLAKSSSVPQADSQCILGVVKVLPFATSIRSNGFLRQALVISRHGSRKFSAEIVVWRSHFFISQVMSQSVVFDLRLGSGLGLASGLGSRLGLGLGFELE